MKSISIHGIEEKVLKAISERANKEGRSVNKVVKELMAQGLGMKEKPPDHRADFADLCGVWTEEEAAEFAEAIADLERTEPQDWK